MKKIILLLLISLSIAYSFAQTSQSHTRDSLQQALQKKKKQIQAGCCYWQNWLSKYMNPGLIPL